MKATLLIFIIILFANGCEKTEDTNLKDKFIGEWIEVQPCPSCHTYFFSENDTLYISEENGTIKASYSILSEDSIRVKWINPWTKTVETHNKYVFYTNDSLKLVQFMPVLIGLTGFTDVTLTKK